MSRITMDNYEAFVLDHLEGRLSQEDLHELRTFLLLHPELQVDLDNEELPYLDPKDSESMDLRSLRKESTMDEEIIAYMEGLMGAEEKLAFEKKLSSDQLYRDTLAAFEATRLVPDFSDRMPALEDLKHSEEDLIAADKAFAYVEGLLSAEESEKVLQSEEWSALANAYERTRLVVDHTILYPEKDELKKEAKVFVLFSRTTYISVAAAVLLLFGLSLLFKFSLNDTVADPELANKQLITPVQKDSAEEIKTIESIPQETKQLANASVNALRKTQASLNSMIGKKKEQAQEPKDNLLAEKKEQNVKEIVEPSYGIDTASTAKAKVQEPAETHKEQIKNKETNTTHPVTLLAYESDDEKEAPEENRKPGFLQRLAKLAGEANKLGVKAVNGKEKDGEGYLLALNSLSIEKK